MKVVNKKIMLPDVKTYFLNLFWESFKTLSSNDCEMYDITATDAL